MTGTSELAPGKTLPEIAQLDNHPLDKLRRAIRRRPELARMLRRVGPTRIVPAEAVEEFRAAVRVAMA
ncbi:MAG: hypothetical protein JWO38_822 [Gemmataceae bacterium]|nr:hypothetical protein [Gemmataceae bacterium]